MFESIGRQLLRICFIGEIDRFEGGEQGMVGQTRTKLAQLMAKLLKLAVVILQVAFVAQELQTCPLYHLNQVNPFGGEARERAAPGVDLFADGAYFFVGRADGGGVTLGKRSLKVGVGALQLVLLKPARRLSRIVVV